MPCPKGQYRNALYNAILCSIVLNFSSSMGTGKLYPDQLVINNNLLADLGFFVGEPLK